MGVADLVSPDGGHRSRGTRSLNWPRFQTFQRVCILIYLVIFEVLPFRIVCSQRTTLRIFSMATRAEAEVNVRSIRRPKWRQSIQRWLGTLRQSRRLLDVCHSRLRFSYGSWGEKTRARDGP